MEVQVCPLNQRLKARAHHKLIISVQFPPTCLHDSGIRIRLEFRPPYWADLDEEKLKLENLTLLNKASPILWPSEMKVYQQFGNQRRNKLPAC